MELEQAKKEWDLARTSFYQAQENFNNADPEMVDVAIHDLQIAEQRMDNALKRYKKLMELISIETAV